MSSTQLEHPDPATVYDCVMRFTIPSRSRANETHMVDLDSYHCNGECSCEVFNFDHRPHLARGITPAEALAQGLVTLKRKNKPDKHPDDALRCDHIVDAYRQFAVIAARSISNANKIQHTQTPHSPRPFIRTHREGG